MAEQVIVQSRGPLSLDAWSLGSTDDLSLSALREAWKRSVRFLKRNGLEPASFDSIFREDVLAGSTQARQTASVYLSELFLKMNCPKTFTARPEPDPCHRRDPVYDIADYIESWTDQYHRCVELCSALIPPMHPDNKLSICIPVAGLEEAKYIYHGLKSFASQSVDPNSFELILYLNFPKSEEQLDLATNPVYREIERFRSDYPNLPVHVFSAALQDGPLRSIGFIRSISFDVPLLRHFERMQNSDHILVRCDADTRGVDKDYVRSILKTFRDKPQIDAVSGRLIWSPEAGFVDALMFVNQRLEDLLYGAFRAFAGIYKFGGPNFAIRASSYAMVHGYREDVRLAEDVELFERLHAFRAGGPNAIDCVAVGALSSTIYTSTRRASLALKEGATSSSQWSNLTTKFGADNPHVRLRDEIPDNPGPSLGESKLIREVEKVINRSIIQYGHFWPTFREHVPLEADKARYFGGRPIESPLFLRALDSLLGAGSYRVRGGRLITISDPSFLLKKIKLVQSMGRKDWERRLTHDRAVRVG